jgi:hypothetical protein
MPTGVEIVRVRINNEMFSLSLAEGLSYGIVTL